MLSNYILYWMLFFPLTDYTFLNCVKNWNCVCDCVIAFFFLIKFYMMRRSSSTFTNLLQNRRRWEQRVASMLGETREHNVDSAAARFQRIYKDRQFTPVEEAFPLLNKTQWNDLPQFQHNLSFLNNKPKKGDEDENACMPNDSSSRISSIDDSNSSNIRNSEKKKTKSQYILHATFLGPQNAGKTALVNALALSHVGAVCHRHGSTKDWTKAIATVHNTQLLLLDTPGIVLVRGEKDRRRHAAASVRSWDSLFVADLVVCALPVGMGFVEREHKTIVR